jgi:hypothetical protein
MASFVVIYLGQLGFGDYWPSFLSSSVLWFLVFFLPILSGTIADQIGFRRAAAARPPGDRLPSWGTPSGSAAAAVRRRSEVTAAPGRL